MILAHVALIFAMAPSSVFIVYTGEASLPSNPQCINTELPNIPIFEGTLWRPRILLVQRHRRCDLGFGMAGGIEVLESLRRSLRPSAPSRSRTGRAFSGFCNDIGLGDF